MKTTQELAKQAGMEPVAWELRKGKTDRVLIQITNNPEIAHNWKCSLDEVVPLHTADQLAAARLQGQEEGQQMAQIGRVDQRIAELESELLEQARVNGMGGEREATLMARVAVLEAQLVECEAKQEHCKSMFLQMRVAMGLGLHSDDDLLEYAKQLAECKADAERYRWIRGIDNDSYKLVKSAWLKGLDNAIDAELHAARSGKGGEV